MRLEPSTSLKTRFFSWDCRWWRVALGVIIVIICNPLLRWMLPDPINIMGFMSPGVTGGGRARWPVGPEKISAHHFFCFCSRLCRHLDPVSLQHMLPRREDYSSSKCKINTSEVTDAPSSQAERRGSGFPASEAAGTEERDFVHSRRAALSL